VARRVAVIGVGNTEYGSIKSDTREKSQVAFTAVKAALNMAGITISDVDATVFSTVDGFEGVNRIDRTIDAFGQGYNIPVISVNTGGTAGASAFKEAFHLVASGLYDIVLVYGSSTAGDVADIQQILNTASPPLFEKCFGIGAIHMAAFYCTRYMAEYGATEEDFALVAAKNHAAAAKNPYAHIRKGYSMEEVLASPVISSPLRLHEICPVSSGAVALVIASEDRAKELTDTPVWVKAIGSIANAFLSGFREYKGFDKLKILAQRVYSMAGITDPRKQIDVAEVFNPFSPFELLHYEALGFCGEGKARELLREGVTSAGGELPVNMSGGVLCTNSGIAASLTRFGDVALQLMGKFEGIQVKSPEIGLGHAWGGNLGQFHNVVIFSRE